MKAKIVIALLFTLHFGTNNIYAQLIKDTTVVDFKTIDNTISEKIIKYGVKDVLVVVDIDNTILTSDTDLGSDIWYQWQSGELEVKPTSEQKLSPNCLFNEAIPLLYELGTMTYTDSLVPTYIKKWQNSGVTVIALTSRSPLCRAATERELQRNGINLSLSELKTIDGNRLNLSYTLSNRDVSYLNGVFMTSGLNKGEMINHILGRTGKTYKSVVFADDTRKNIDNVKNKYLTPKDADLVLFYYTKIVTERKKRNNNVILTKEQADKMHADWVTLIKTLNTIFPGRLSKSKCN